MSARLKSLLQDSSRKILSIYFTAGFPKLNDTRLLLIALQDSGVDLVEIGMPFSDPLADGPTIQRSNERALANGMSIKLLFKQLEDFRRDCALPVMLMGYLNPLLQYGLEAFCAKAQELGIDGLILPDLPLNEFEKHYRRIFETHDLSSVFLITPQTTDQRIRYLDSLSTSFLYAVSTAATTGKNLCDDPNVSSYLERLSKLNLQHPFIVGFGVQDGRGFSLVTRWSRGAIIGSAFIRALEEAKDPATKAKEFVAGLGLARA